MLDKNQLNSQKIINEVMSAIKFLDQKKVQEVRPHIDKLLDKLKIMTAIAQREKTFYSKEQRGIQGKLAEIGNKRMRVSTQVQDTQTTLKSKRGEFQAVQEQVRDFNSLISKLDVNIRKHDKLIRHHESEMKKKNVENTVVSIFLGPLAGLAIGQIRDEIDQNKAKKKSNLNDKSIAQVNRGRKQQELNRLNSEIRVLSKQSSELSGSLSHLKRRLLKLREDEEDVREKIVFFTRIAAFYGDIYTSLNPDMGQAESAANIAALIRNDAPMNVKHKLLNVMLKELKESLVEFDRFLNQHPEFLKELEDEIDAYALTKLAVEATTSYRLPAKGRKFLSSKAEHLKNKDWFNNNSLRVDVLKMKASDFKLLDTL